MHEYILSNEPKLQYQRLKTIKKGSRAIAVSLPYVISIGVCASAEPHGAVTVEELLEERAAGEPHPAAGVHAPVRIQQKLLEHLKTHNGRNVSACATSGLSQLRSHQFMHELVFGYVCFSLLCLLPSI